MKYRVLHSIGGDTYLALQGDLDRSVVIKVMRSADVPTQMQALVKLVKAQIPHVVPIYDMDRFDEFTYFVMPFLSGGTMRQRLEKCIQSGRTLPSVAEINRLLQPLAIALDRLHHIGIRHQSVTPESIIFDQSGNPCWIRLSFIDTSPVELLSDEEGEIRVGVWPYIPIGSSISPASIHHQDIYGLAMTIYEVLNGDLPFKGQNERNIFDYMIARREPQPDFLHWRQDLPETLLPVFQKAFAYEPTTCYPTAGAFAEAFAAVTSQVPAVNTGFFDVIIDPPSDDGNGLEGFPATL